MTFDIKRDSSSSLLISSLNISSEDILGYQNCLGSDSFSIQISNIRNSFDLTSPRVIFFPLNIITAFKGTYFHFYMLLLLPVLCRVAALKSLPVHHP